MDGLTYENVIDSTVFDIESETSYKLRSYRELKKGEIEDYLSEDVSEFDDGEIMESLWREMMIEVNEYYGLN